MIFMRLKYQIPAGFKQVKHGKVRLKDWVADWREMRWICCDLKEWPVGDLVSEMDGVIRAISDKSSSCFTP